MPGGTVLIVDSQAEFTAPLADSLRGAGFEVQTTSDGKEALASVQQKRPDAIVLCVELPNMSGYSICARLKKNDSLKSIPLIITSAVKETQAGFENHGKLATRAEAYLEKPCPPQRVLGLLEKYVQRGTKSSPPARASTTPAPVVPVTEDLSAPPVGRPESALAPPEVQELRREILVKERQIVDLKSALNAAHAEVVQIRDKEIEAWQRVSELEAARDEAMRTREVAASDAGAHKEKLTALEAQLEVVNRASHELVVGMDQQLRESWSHESRLVAELDEKEKRIRALNEELTESTAKSQMLRDRLDNAHATVKDLDEKISQLEERLEKAH
jgi:CheY-like chemotaxis protein